MRIPLELSKAESENVKNLLAKAGFESYSELFNNAATLLQWSIQQLENGRSIISVDDGTGETKQLWMPFFDRIGNSTQQESEMLSASPANRDESLG
ncbi:MAG: hypothetical protein JOY54_03750 [Acidobacteriaceae bacterium]|nr:hypothetical protein [Acidobacteriaceae bacterium]